MAGADAISIHALREEGDKSLSPPPPLPNNFYPRPPRGGRHRPKALWRRLLYFYPRPPRGGRPLLVGIPPTVRVISIHALREEGDVKTGIPSTKVLYFYPRPPRGGRRDNALVVCSKVRFLSTPSARRATAVKRVNHFVIAISIHALREEGDLGGLKNALVGFDFYPRPPRGGRHRAIVRDHECRGFLSTPSARRATDFDNYSE